MQTVYYNYVEIKPGARGPPTRAAFGDIRSQPNHNLTNELVDYPVNETVEAEHEGQRSNEPTDHLESPTEFMERLRQNAPTE